jgi:hypothetical protein
MLRILAWFVSRDPEGWTKHFHKGKNSEMNWKDKSSIYMFSISASLNSYSNLGVLAVVTWQVLFISVPMIVLTIRLQVKWHNIFGKVFRDGVFLFFTLGNIILQLSLMMY